MRKHLIIAGIICVASIPPATAVTKCVALNTGTTCSASGSLYYSTNWSANCKTNGQSVTILGVAACSNTKGSSNGQTVAALGLSDNLDDNDYCWCRMISPAVSNWVYYGQLNSGSECATRCSDLCRGVAMQYQSFRSAIFSNLSD